MLLGHTLGSVPVGPLPVALVLVAMAALWLWQLGREPALAQARLLLGIVLAMGLAQALAGHIKVDIPPRLAAGDRYLFMFKLGFWSLLPLLPPASPRLRLVLCAAGLLALGAVAWQHPRQILRPAQADLEWASYADAIDRGEAVEVPVHPRGWTLRLPASLARNEAGPTAPAPGHGPDRSRQPISATRRYHRAPHAGLRYRPRCRRPARAWPVPKDSACLQVPSAL